MSVVTPDFIDRVIRNGRLTEAQVRARDGTAHPQNKAQWDKFSSWALVCEEVLDTDSESDWYDDVLAELTRRGFTNDQINRMRRFAWQTAGWLNYDKMAWEWGSLDEKDIRMALSWQLREGLITSSQHTERLAYIDDPTRLPETA